MAPIAITPPAVDVVVTKDLKGLNHPNHSINSNHNVATQKPAQPQSTVAVHSPVQTAPVINGTSPKESHFTGFDNFNLKSVLIPQSTGLGMIKKYYQRRTLYQYIGLFGVGLTLFHYQESSTLRVLGLGLLFPGAGFTAIPSVSSFISGIVCALLFPVALFVWFGCGAFIAPIALWVGSASYAARKAGSHDILWDRAGTIWPILCVSLIVWTTNKAKSINLAGWSKKQERNKYLISAVQEQQMTAVATPAMGSREVDLKTLRFIQHMVERGLTGIDDFSKNDIIDQFREAAIRYQLYGVIDILSLYMTHFAPGFHGYAAQACRNSIEKSLTKRVLYYWKWESMIGKFKFDDWDPIKEDNIMVTGYLGVAMGLYESATGDSRYHETDCMDMVIADGKHYKTCYEGLADALESNMYRNPYCLYPCEPNWTYSLCNLTGMASLIVSDRILGQDRSEKLKPRFERALEEEFTEPDGRILAVRNETTGLTIPGFCGTLSDCINAVLMTAYLPHLAHRNWAIIRKEFVGYDEKNKLYIKDLKGADKIDPCNYRVSDGPIRAYVAMAAAEFGDEKIRKECLEQLDETYFPVEASPSGGLFNKGLSASSQVISLMARLLRHGDLANATKHGPEPNAMKGPLLEHVPFPEVLVAKAYSSDGVNLDLVLHPGKAAGKFKLGFERLTPGGRYKVGKNANMTADQHGNGEVEVFVEGRTELTVGPV